MANPKSAILASPLLNNILAGFKSLWTIFNLISSFRPNKIYFNNLVASL